MSSTMKLWAGILVIIVVGAAGYWYWSAHEGSGAMQGESMSPSGSDTSDAGLDQDTASIDAQLSGLDSDSADLDQSFSDQPVQQSY